VLHQSNSVIFSLQTQQFVIKHVATLTNNNCKFMTNCCVCRLNITLLTAFLFYDLMDLKYNSD
jgi:hypothetical protein